MENNRTSPFWDMLSLLIWAMLFAAGLVPDLAFEVLRGLANVRTSDALVNSSYAISFALSGYIAVFVLQRAREANAPEPEARAKAFVAACMALVAFLELPNRGASPFEPRTFLEIWINFRILEDPYARNVILVAGIAKVLCWWYLFALFLRYYAFGNASVFRTLPLPIPSLRSQARAPVLNPAAESSNGKLAKPEETAPRASEVAE